MAWRGIKKEPHKIFWGSTGNQKTISYMQLYTSRRVSSSGRVKAKEVIRLSNPAPYKGFGGKIRPQGKFSVGIIPRKRGDRSQSHEDDSGHLYEYLYSDRYVYGQGLVRSYHYVPDDKYPPLNRFISSKESSQPTKKYGLHGITRYGRNMVEDGCYLLEKSYNVRNLGFYTLTVPSVSDEEYELIALSWSNIVRVFFQKLRRIYVVRRLRFSYVSVTEIQEGRYVKTGLPVLHIHYVARALYRGRFILSADRLRKIWHETLSLYIKRDFSVSAACDAQLCKSSSAGYLSKYMSKSGGVVSEIAEKSPELLPSQWWSMSNGLRQAVKRATIKLSEAQAEYLFYVCGGKIACTDVEYAHPVQLVGAQGETKIIGYAGKLSAECVSEFLSSSRWAG